VRVSQAPEGIHEATVTDWMVAQLPEISPPLTFTLIAGGRSNLTYRVEDSDGRAWALRRPRSTTCCPRRTTLSVSTADALARAAGIPVPVTVGLCTDEAVNERPFYVMEFVEGHILRNAPEPSRIRPGDRGGVGVTWRTRWLRCTPSTPMRSDWAIWVGTRAT